MRLPAHLLLKLGFGVGFGTVLSGCDLVEDVKAAIEDEPEAAAVEGEADATDPEASADSAPAPKTGGLAGKVARTLEQTQASAAPEPLVAMPRAPEPDLDAEVPMEDPEDITAFVPFGGSSAKLPPIRERVKPRPKPRPPIALAETPDPAVERPVLGSTRPTHDPCPACGRG